ncbi:hypothetical protein ACIQ6K_30170 [Streptomyces sp. NPDC096354]|uniref:hypothetical protein n=1 Tax=Streptomyces sp. NPDC096354 TaxID=3366088 RepID=UPI00380334E5
MRPLRQGRKGRRFPAGHVDHADTAVPELVAAAVVGYGHGLQAEGTVIRGVVRAAAAPPRSTDLAPSCWRARGRPGEDDGPGTPGEYGTRLLPDTRTVHDRQLTPGRLMLEAVTPTTRPSRPPGAALPRRWPARARLAHLP